jgi:hypothetical protein
MFSYDRKLKRKISARDHPCLGGRKWMIHRCIGENIVTYVDKFLHLDGRIVRQFQTRPGLTFYYPLFIKQVLKIFPDIKNPGLPGSL